MVPCCTWARRTDGPRQHFSQTEIYVQRLRKMDDKDRRTEQGRQGSRGTEAVSDLTAMCVLPMAGGRVLG